MRAREFVINIPINIRINGDGEPEVGVGDDQENTDPVGDDEKVMVPPLQQDLELRKAALGKQSLVSDQILDPDGDGPMQPPSDARRAGVADSSEITQDNLGVGMFD